MRIFKNRGAIYFSKSNKKKSNEQKILILALVAIVCFTVVFLTALAISNDFSAKKFFAPDEPVSVSSQQEEQVILPKVSGKSNVMGLITKGNKLLFASLIQVDMDSVSYKVCTLKPETEIDGVPLYKIFANGSALNVKNAVESLLSVEFDYYIQMESDDFADFYNKLGKVNYAVADDIRHKSDNLGVSYSVNLKESEQALNGSQAVNLTRYYLEKGNTSAANDLMLCMWQQQLNADNYENGDKLFAQLISASSTNITVRDFASATNELTVLTSTEAGVGAYSASAQYSKNQITPESVQEIRGYFVK